MPETVLQNQRMRKMYERRKRLLRRETNKLLSPEARDRFGNVRFAHPKLAERAEEYIVQQGHIVSEYELIKILKRLQVNHG